MRIFTFIFFYFISNYSICQSNIIIDCARENKIEFCLQGITQYNDSKLIISEYFKKNKLSYINEEKSQYNLTTKLDSIFDLLLESEFFIKSAKINEDKAFLNYKKALQISKYNESLHSEVLRSINNYLNFSTQDLELYKTYINKYLSSCNSTLDCSWAEFCRIKYIIRSNRDNPQNLFVSDQEWDNLITICKENSFRYLLLDVYCSYGSYLSNKPNQYEKSIKINSKAIDLAKIIGANIYNQNNFLLVANTSNIKMKQGKFDEALLGFNRLSKIEISNQRIDNQSMFYGWKSECYENTGKLDSALHYIRLSKEKKAEANNLKFDTEIRKIEETFKNKELSQDLLYNNLQLEKQKTYNYILVIGLFGLVGLSYLVYNSLRLKRRVLIEKVNRVEAEQRVKTLTALSAERTRIASEMHDDLGGGLTTIKFLSQKVLRKSEDDSTKEQVKKIVNQSETLVNNMSEIIWAMNSGFDTLSSLISYSRRYAHEYLETHGIDLAFKTNGNTSGYNLSGTKRRNVFLVIKEALHNAVKHSKCDKITITFIVSEGLQIAIKDNGIGIKGKNDLGNGLSNMKVRMQNIGGKANFENENGLKVLLSLSELKKENKEFESN